MAMGWDLRGYKGVGGIFPPKFNQICCVSYSHDGICIDTFFGPRPLGPWGGVKRSNIIKFQLLSQFPIFSNQTLCVISQMKDIQHIRRDFQSVTWVMPQELDFGGTGWLGCLKLFFSENQPNLVYE